MKKKGYTLVELLGILAVMSIMLLIIVPNVITTMKNADDERYEIFKKTIEQAAEVYVENNSHLFPEIGSGRTGFGKVQDLIDAGYLKSTLVNPATKESVDGNTYFLVVVNGDMTKTYTYLEDALPISMVVDTLLRQHSTYTYMGGTYLKGAVANNYVWYNGFIWRIMGKNSDGSIRLITEENVATIPWGSETTNNTYGTSYIKDWTNNYFLPRLKDTSDIVNSYFCEDSTLVTSSSSKRTTCSNPVASKAGILSLDEYNLAEGKSGYLKNGQIQWMLTPYSSSNAWALDNGGNATLGIAVSDAYGVRAVISISSNTIITGGNGTLSANADTEYILNQTLDNVTGTLESKTGSGEYISFDGRLYRIVEHTNNGTKVIQDGFYNTNTAYGSNFTTMSTLITGSTYLNWLLPTRQSEVINTTWYRGDYFGTLSTSYDYKTNLSSTANSFTNKVGLIRLGEILSGQSLSLLTSNYYSTTSTSNTRNYWTLTPTSSSYAWDVGNLGVSSYISVTSARGVRAVIVLPSSMQITSGNGTLSSPYQV